MLPDNKIHEYIGQPYDECDCWDLVKLFYKDSFNREMPFETNYGAPGNDEAYRKKISKIVEIHSCHFEEVDTPKFGDIILFKILGLPAHVGIYLDKKTFLHSIRETGCCIEPMSKWENKIEGYYRWPE